MNGRLSARRTSHIGLPFDAESPPRLARWSVASAVTLALTLALPARAAAAEGARAAAPEPLAMVVPDRENLQLMAFWVADGAGYFADEGITPDLRVPASPPEVDALVQSDAASVAVLPPPTYLRLIAARVPIVLVANLLRNEPIDLVVRGDVAAAHGLDVSAPVDARLRALHGVKVGVAPNPVSRVRALFAAYGMDADHDVELVIVPGKQQNQAFADRRVDALFAHTPFLEKAMVEQGATLAINASAGEVPALASRQIHVLCVKRTFLQAQPERTMSLVRAVDRAEQLVRTDPAATVAALARVFPTRARAELETIVRLYAPAMPETPEVSIEGTRAALALFPATQKAPDLAGLDLAPYVASAFAADAAELRNGSRTTRVGRRTFVVFVIAATLMLLAGLGLARRAQAGNPPPPGTP